MYKSHPIIYILTLTPVLFSIGLHYLALSKQMKCSAFLKKNKKQAYTWFLLKKKVPSASHLREMPRLLLHVGHLVTVEELRKAADLIVHHTASVLPRAAQRAQEQLTLFGVTS